MQGLKHPLSGAIYELDDDGNVLVSKGGEHGVFDTEGNWLSGELRSADPHVCGWLSTQPLPSRFRRTKEDEE